MSSLYLIANGAQPAASALVKVATSATLATMLQVKLGDNQTNVAKIVEWGISLDGSSAATPFQCELLAGTVAATVTAHADVGINRLSKNTIVPTNNFPFAFGATNETGYTSSSEGTLAGARVFDLQNIAPSNQYVKQFPLGREPDFSVADWLRIRIWGDGTVKASCYVIIEV